MMKKRSATADYVVDLGPGAGVHGGEIVAPGTPAEVSQYRTVLTGQYLSGNAAIAVPDAAPQDRKKRMLTVIGATGNNLKNVTPDSRSACCPASPACRAAASRR